MQSQQPGGLQPPPKKKMATWVIVLVGVAVFLVAMVVFLGLVAGFGMRSYLADAKAVEAKHTLGNLGRAALQQYEMNDTPGAVRLCPSASKPVPATRDAVRGKKYQSIPAEWKADEAAHAGFACLEFEMTEPQYFQYEYEANAGGFIARAHGDTDGDGTFSTYELRGTLQGDTLTLAPSITEINPGE